MGRYRMDLSKPHAQVLPQYASKLPLFHLDSMFEGQLLAEHIKRVNEDVFFVQRLNDLHQLSSLQFRLIPGNGKLFQKGRVLGCFGDEMADQALVRPELSGHRRLSIILHQHLVNYLQLVR